jgi:hypothetical protein
MNAYIYPTRINLGDEWLEDMLIAWKGSGCNLLCFPWIGSQVHTIKDHRFWLYMYYSHAQSDISEMKGVIEYRLRIIDLQATKLHGNNIFLARENEPGVLWFLSDRYEKIIKIKHERLYLEDFYHAENKRLGSTMRNSIPPVVCNAKLIVTEHYP